MEDFLGSCLASSFGFVMKVCERETFGRWDAAHIVVGVAPKLEHLARSRNYSERAACAIRAPPGGTFTYDACTEGKGLAQKQSMVQWY